MEQIADHTITAITITINRTTQKITDSYLCLKWELNAWFEHLSNHKLYNHQD